MGLHLNSKKTRSIAIPVSARFSLILSLFLIGTSCFSQLPDSTWIGLGNRNIDSSMAVYYHGKTENLRVVYNPSQDKEVIVEYVDSSRFFLDGFNLSHLSSVINIQYLTDSIWFIYGTRTEYAHYPVILCSRNAGQTWAYVLRHELNDPDVYLERKSFFMFDENHGIWIIDRGRNSIRYRITQDGGTTWKNKRIHYKWKRLSAHQREILRSRFTQSGEVELTVDFFMIIDGRGHESRSSVFLSSNCGRTFRRVRK